MNTKPFDSLVRDALEKAPCRSLASVLAAHSLAADKRTRDRAWRMSVLLNRDGLREFEATRAALGHKVYAALTNGE